MRAVIVGAGMGGLMTALALRQSGAFSSVEVYEQTKEPSTAGAGLNIPPMARGCVAGWVLTSMVETPKARTAQSMAVGRPS